VSEEVPQEHVFVWNYQKQPPMDEIAAAVAELSGGTVVMTTRFTGTDEHKLAVSRGNGERPAVYARFLRIVNPLLADHEIAAAWGYSGPDECAFWRELEAATGATE
jgi:hypothetical protein